jgi:hypothetical protein
MSQHIRRAKLIDVPQMINVLWSVVIWTSASDRCFGQRV